MPGPEKLKGFDLLTDKLNRLVLARIIKQQLGPEASVKQQRAVPSVTKKIMDDFLSRGHSPDTISNALMNALEGRGAFGMSNADQVPMPTFTNPDTDFPSAEHPDFKARQEALARGKPTRGV